MKFSVSDLPFGSFSKAFLKDLPMQYDIEIFYEFGTDHYWDYVLKDLKEKDGVSRRFSIHGPCVAVNLADPNDTAYLDVYDKTFAYAQKINAEFVVVHSNEAWRMGGEKLAVQELVYGRIEKLLQLAGKYGVTVALENVGLRTTGTLLFEYEEYLGLFKRFPNAAALLDTGHAHVNGWKLSDVLRDLNKKLVGVHIHDNDGTADAHLPVGCGNIDWNDYFTALKEYAPQAVQVCEYAAINQYAMVTESLAKLEEAVK